MAAAALQHRRGGEILGEYSLEGLREKWAFHGFHDTKYVHVPTSAAPQKRKTRHCRGLGSYLNFFLLNFKQHCNLVLGDLNS